MNRLSPVVAPRLELAEKKRWLTGLGVVAPPPLHIQTPLFEGSLASLFACVRDRKLELTDVPLYPICEAYFQYLLQSQIDTLDEAAAALAALAFLLERKAWSLLPTPEAEPEMEDELSSLPSTVHEFGDAIQALRLWHDERSRIHFRTSEGLPQGYELPFTLEDVSILDLARAFERLMRRANPEPASNTSRPRRSLSEVMGQLIARLKAEPAPLHHIVPLPIARSEAVYWFLALLELIRLAQVRVHRLDDELLFARPD